MVLVWFRFLPPKLLPSIQFSPKTVTVSFASKSFMNVSGFLGSTRARKLGFGWIRFNLKLTSMVTLAAQYAGVAKPGQRRSPEAAVP